ncbi:MAG TPA: phosphatase PAP2 family protein [Candidatus Polarisedimenticolia bacterium]|nr:phosphatase PAP2 family protein [Candidatus Polarisedimenticolia bacterium]
MTWRAALRVLTAGCVLVCGLALTLPVECFGSETSDRDTPLLLAAESTNVASDAWSLPSESPDLTADIGAHGWFGEMWRKHRYHFLTVFLLEEADYLYERQVGPPKSPRLFGSPGPLDRSIQDRLGQDSGGRNFIIQHKTTFSRAVALGAMLMVNGRDWEGFGDDVIGLAEAHKLNWAAAGLVKNIVGRPRPALEESLQTGMDLDEISRENDVLSSRDSFYSDATSKAFTYMAYTDSVLARRLRGRPWARAFTAAGLYGLAGYIGYSRLDEGKHYFTDVVAGAGAGFALGKISYRWNHSDDAEARASRLRVQPLLVPAGAGVLFTLELPDQLRRGSHAEP